jgi:hypothetical protein
MNLMKTIEILKKRIYPLFFIVFAGIIIFNMIRLSSSGNDKVIPYKVSGGWGYQIEHNEKVYIDQPFIPLISGKHAFPDRKSARKTGKLVLKRLKEQKLPVISYDDLHKLGLDSIGVQ